MECQHEFIGNRNGVACRRCGKSMTAEQYRLYLHPPEPPKKKAQTPPYDESKPKAARKRKEAEA